MSTHKSIKSIGIGLVLAIGLAGVLSAQGAVLVEETFNYPAGSLHGANGGIGFAAPWDAYDPEATNWQEFRVFEGPLDYVGYEAQGNRIRTATTSVRPGVSTNLQYGDRALVPISTATHSELYMGLSFMTTTLYSPASFLRVFDSNDPSKYILIDHWRGLSGDVIGPDGEPTGATANARHFRVSLGGPTATTQPFGWQHASSKGINVPLFVLMKFVFMEESTVALISFFESPEPLPTEEPIWDAWVAVPAKWDVNFDTLRVHAENDINRGGNLGDIRIGTTLNDVLLVPEPATMSLLGLGGLMMLRRRR